MRKHNVSISIKELIQKDTLNIQNRKEKQFAIETRKANMKWQMLLKRKKKRKIERKEKKT